MPQDMQMMVWGKNKVSCHNILFALLLLHALTCGFCVVRLEVVIDPWLQGLWSAVKEACKMASNKSDHLKEKATAESPASSIQDVKLNLLSLSDHQYGAPGDAEHASTYASAALLATSGSQTALSEPKLATFVGSLGVASAVSETRTDNHARAASLTYSLPPLSESALNVPVLPPTYLDVSLQEVDTIEEVRCSKCTVDHIFDIDLLRKFIFRLLGL